MNDRLISLNTAIDAFKKELTVGESKGNYVTICSAVGYEGAKHILESLPSAQQWIPWDSGKFPGESGYYTVTAFDGATKRVTYAKYQKRLKRWELTGARAYWRVLAWLPPLEPWRGDKHEAE